jgi:hypothetical protein
MRRTKRKRKYLLILMGLEARIQHAPATNVNLALTAEEIEGEQRKIGLNSLSSVRLCVLCDAVFCKVDESKTPRYAVKSRSLYAFLSTMRE